MPSADTPGNRAAGPVSRKAADGQDPRMTRAEDARTAGGTGRRHTPATAVEDTLDLRLTEELLALFAADAPPADGPAASPLLDAPGSWRPVTTPAGIFQLVPVRLERDLAVVTRWMNDPAVAAFWELAGDEDVTARHLAAQLEGDGRSVPCLGVLDGKAMSYWEIYRADLDPLARHYPARPHDTGVHLLIGGVTDRGRRVGTTLLRAVSDLVLDHRPSCARVVAEPDLRNTPSVSAFLSAGFRFSAELELPEKKAALMVRDRAHRDHL